MNPFLRPTNSPHAAPDGWVAEPAGIWAGKEVDVFYDPVRHDVAFIRADIGDDMRARFGDIGYEQLGVDGSNEMWVRDRRSSLSAAWDRVGRSTDREQTIEIGGRGL